MNRILTLALSALISLHTGAIELSSPSNKISCPELGNSFECAQEIEKNIIEHNNEIIYRKSGVLRIISVSGHIYEVVENKGEEDSLNAEHFLAVGVSDDKRFVSLYVQYFEGNSWSIFDRNNNILTPVCGYPIFSPKKNYVAFSEMNPYTEMTPTCLQVFEIENAGIKEVFDAKMGYEWWPDKAKWVGETKLIFEKVVWNPLRGQEGQPDFISANYSLNVDDGKWVMIAK